MSSLETTNHKAPELLPVDFAQALRPLRMVGIAPHGGQWLDPGLLACGDVVGAEIARVGDCLLHLG